MQGTLRPPKKQTPLLSPPIQVEALDAQQVQTPDVERQMMLSDSVMLAHTNRSVLSSKRGSVDTSQPVIIPQSQNLTQDYPLQPPSGLELVIDDFSATQDRENKP